MREADGEFNGRKSSFYSYLAPCCMNVHPKSLTNIATPAQKDSATAVKGTAAAVAREPAVTAATEAAAAAAAVAALVVAATAAAAHALQPAGRLCCCR